MKILKNNLVRLMLMLPFLALSQTLVEIPTPVGFTNPNRGCRGDMLVYQNQLLLLYEKNDYARVLFKFDGTNLTEIPSPEDFDGAYGGYNNFSEITSPTILNGILYMHYSENDISAPSHLFSYDGTTLTQIPTPPQYLQYGAGLGNYLRTLGSNFIGNYRSSIYDGDLFTYDGNTITIYPTPTSHRGPYHSSSSTLGSFPPTIVGNNIFLRYRQDDINLDLFKFDGTTLTEIPSPIGFENESVGNVGLPYVFGDVLYMRYKANNNSYSLVKYQENTLTVIPNPTGFNDQNHGYAGNPIGFGSNLYLKYKNAESGHFLYKYDGTALTLVPSPENYLGVLGTPFVFQNNLYQKYNYTLATRQHLFKYDGNTFIPLFITEAPGLDPETQGYREDPVFVGENVYLRYFGRASSIDNHFYLVKFDGTTLTAIPTPPNYQNNVRGYKDLPFVVGSNIFMRYQHNNGSYVLFKYDGTTLTEIPSPPGYNNNERGYVGSPTFYNDNLYFRYRSNTGQYVLFKYEDSSLNIEEHVNDQELFTVYPNPAKDYLTVHYEANQKHDITVYSSLGKLLATYKNAENNFQVPVAHLANGLYFITVRDDSGKTATLKFVKN